MLIEGITLEEAEQILKDNKQNRMTKYFKIYTVTDKRNGYNTYDEFYPSELTPVNINTFETENKAINWLSKHGSFDAKYVILPIYGVNIDDINK